MTLLLALAILPGIALSYYVWWRDKHEREPKKYLIACFIFGILSVVPAILLETLGQHLGIVDGPNVFITFLFAVAVVGFSEELSKYVFLRYYIFPKSEFCEPMDGIVYSVLVSMGFATLENIMYVMQGGLGVALLRMFLSVPAHAAFAVIMGYFVGLAKFTPGKRNLYLLTGLLLAALVHGLFDFFIFQKLSQALVVFTFITFIVAIIMSRYMIHWHVESSPYKDEK